MPFAREPDRDLEEEGDNPLDATIGPNGLIENMAAVDGEPVEDGEDEEAEEDDEEGETEDISEFWSCISFDFMFEDSSCSCWVDFVSSGPLLVSSPSAFSGSTIVVEVLVGFNGTTTGSGVDSRPAD